MTPLSYTRTHTHTGTVLDSAVIEVTLAKPVDKETYMRSPKYQRQFNNIAME